MTEIVRRTGIFSQMRTISDIMKLGRENNSERAFCMVETRIIVAGSRNFTDAGFIFGKLDEIIGGIKRDNPGHGDIVIVSGCCRGVDSVGESYAKARGYSLARFPANWTKCGRGAGPIRNEDMASFASEGDGHLVAFWDGKSAGTRSMIALAGNRGLSVNIVKISI